MAHPATNSSESTQAAPLGFGPTKLSIDREQPKDAKELLESTRHMADKWLNAVTGLSGLLGIGSIAFGRDVFTEMEGVRLFLLVVVFVAAVVSAAAALVACTGAAYGFPAFPSRPGRKEKALRSALQKWSVSSATAEQATISLWTAMICAVISLLLAIAAVVIAVI